MNHATEFVLSSFCKKLFSHLLRVITTIFLTNKLIEALIKPNIFGFKSMCLGPSVRA